MGNSLSDYIKTLFAKFVFSFSNQECEESSNSGKERQRAENIYFNCFVAFAAGEYESSLINWLIGLRYPSSKLWTNTHTSCVMIVIDLLATVQYSAGETLDTDIHVDTNHSPKHPATPL